MVERYSLTSLDGVAETFGVAPPAGSVPRFNIAPLQIALIRTAAALVPARWGLLPPWRGHGGKRRPHVLHAPIAAIEPTPLLRNAFKSQRCVVVADGYFVWRRSHGGAAARHGPSPRGPSPPRSGGADRTENKVQPVWVHPSPDPARPHARALAGFAAIAATHRDDGQLSFAILAGPSDPALAASDAAIPLVIPVEHHAAWLTGTREQARALLALPAPRWRADPVSTWVNSIDHDDERCVTPLGNPAQGELF